MVLFLPVWIDIQFLSQSQDRKKMKYRCNGKLLTFDIACFRGGMMGRPPPLMGRGMMYRDPGFGRGGMRPRMGFPPGYGRGGMRYQGVC